jgi:hypothetical protein
VEELHGEPVQAQPRELGDSVLLLADEHELLGGLVDPDELVEPEEELGGLLAGGEDDMAFNVARTVEIAAFAQGELPSLARRDPVFDRRRVRRMPLGGGGET